MENHFAIERLALERYEEGLRLAQQERMIASIPRDTSKSIWKKVLSWVSTRERGDRKPARA